MGHESWSPLIGVYMGALKMTDMKLQDIKLTDHIAGHEILQRTLPWQPFLFFFHTIQFQ